MSSTEVGYLLLFDNVFSFEIATIVSIHYLLVCSTTLLSTVVIIFEVLPPFILPFMCLISRNRRYLASIWFEFLKKAAAFNSCAFSFAIANYVRYSRLKLYAIDLHFFLVKWALKIPYSMSPNTRPLFYSSCNLFWSTVTCLTLLFVFKYDRCFSQYSSSRQLRFYIGDHGIDTACGVWYWSSSLSISLQKMVSISS